MNTLIVGILLDVGIAVGGIYLIKQLKRKQTRQPALSKKIIRNLKFQYNIINTFSENTFFQYKYRSKKYEKS